MPSKKPPQPKAEVSPEDAWFKAMEAILLKIEELKKSNTDINGKMSNLSERRRDHNVGHSDALNRVRDVGLGLSKDELKRLLRSMRAHERWSDHYRAKYDKLARESELNAKAVAMLYEQLSRTPYPGEEPLVESVDVDE